MRRAATTALVLAAIVAAGFAFGYAIMLSLDLLAEAIDAS